MMEILRIFYQKKIVIFKSASFVFLERSHAVLSTIFGIFGKFGIEIGTRKKFGRKKFRRKKSENFWSKKNGDQKISIFDRKKNR